MRISIRLALLNKKRTGKELVLINYFMFQLEICFLLNPWTQLLKHEISSGVPWTEWYGPHSLFCVFILTMNDLASTFAANSIFFIVIDSVIADHYRVATPADSYLVKGENRASIG